MKEFLGIKIIEFVPESFPKSLIKDLESKIVPVNQLSPDSDTWKEIGIYLPRFPREIKFFKHFMYVVYNFIIIFSTLTMCNKNSLYKTIKSIFSVIILFFKFFFFLFFGCTILFFICWKKNEIIIINPIKVDKFHATKFVYAVGKILTIFISTF